MFAFVLLAAGAYWLLHRDSSIPADQGGGFVEVRSGVRYVRLSAVAWTMQALAAKYIAPTPAGPGYAPNTSFGQLRDGGGLNAAAWANQMQSAGLDVAISAGANQSPDATGMLAAFPPSERTVWCGDGKQMAILLQAAPRGA